MVEICAAVSLAGMICCCEAAARINRRYCEGCLLYTSSTLRFLPSTRAAILCQRCWYIPGS